MPAEPSSPFLEPRGSLTGWRRWGYLLALVALTAAAFILFVLSASLDDEFLNGVSAAVAGTAPRPVACRALLPLASRAAAAVLPGPAREAVAEWLPAGAVPPRRGDPAGPQARAATVVLFGWIAVSLLVFVLAVDPFFRAVTGMESAWTLLVPFAALAGLSPLFLRPHYYDLPMLALSTLCLLFMVKRRWAAYGVALAAAALNKETAFLFPLVFAFHYGRKSRMERRRFLPLLLGQAAVVLLVRWGLAAVFADRPGGMVEIQRWDLLAHHLRAYRMDAAVAWIALLLAAASDWREKPAFLKTALGVILPLGAVLAFPPAYELYPVALTLVLHPFIKRLAGGAPEPGGVPEPA